MPGKTIKRNTCGMLTNADIKGVTYHYDRLILEFAGYSESGCHIYAEFVNIDDGDVSLIGDLDCLDNAEATIHASRSDEYPQSNATETISPEPESKFEVLYWLFVIGIIAGIIIIIAVIITKKRI